MTFKDTKWASVREKLRENFAKSVMEIFPSVDAARDVKYCPTDANQSPMPQAAPRTVNFSPRPKPRSGDDTFYA